MMSDAITPIKRIIAEPVSIRIMLVLAVWLLAFWQPLLSAAKVWWINDTYLHCFFIVPAAFYMMWTKRSQWLPLTPRPFWLALIPLLLVLLLALTGIVADVQFFQHVGMFASLPLMITLAVGWRIVLLQAFPLCFMLFAVPVGDELIPLFQTITADMSVYMIQLSGIPVYNTGWFIEIPAGRFLVAEACSGVRFFIAAVVFAAIYAYVSFNDTKRRLIYMLLGIVMPIIANGIRVYGTIMVAHIFGMEYAEGADHLVYGWFFFCIVIILLLVIGECMRPKEMATNAEQDYSLDNNWSRVLNTPVTGTLVLVLLVYMAAAAYYASDQAANAKQLDIAALHSAGVTDPRATLETADGWQPHIAGGQQLFTTLDSQAANIELFIACYGTIAGDSELVSYQHRLFDIDRWSVKQHRTVEIEAGAAARVSVNSTLITTSDGRQRRLVSWYETAQGPATSDGVTKLKQAADRFLGGTGGGARIILSLPVTVAGSQESIEATLLEAAEQHYSAIKEAVSG